MKIAPSIYLVLGALGLAAAVSVPLIITRSGSPALPIWREAASPGPLSAAHAFLGAQCEVCHTANRGIAAASCLTCHDTDTAVLTQPSTAFHAAIPDCRGCHIEHRGTAVRPTEMDHAMLARIGWRKALAASTESSPGNGTAAMPETAHLLARITGRHPADDSASLDCFACHSNRNPHRDATPTGCCGPGSTGTVGSLFGRACAECHATTSWRIAGTSHPSPRSEECAQCHQPPPSHYMGHFHMVSMMVAGQHDARVEQCYLCHQTDAWNDIKGAGWYKHH